MCLKMAISLAALKITFMALGTLMVATLIYTLSIDGLPFRIDLLTPWMKTTLLDFYINVTVLAIWVIYKESRWIAAVLWVILLVCLGSITTCTYIVVQLFKFSAEESTHDPMHYLLLHHQDNRKDASRSFCQLVTAKIFFIALGCLMLGTLLYTIIVYGSPFNKEVLTPWMVATLIDFYINVSALSVWVSYKESSWFTAVIWIVLLICSGSIATCAYVASQFFSLSPHDPMYLVLLNKRQRAESRYETTSRSG